MRAIDDFNVVNRLDPEYTEAYTIRIYAYRHLYNNTDNYDRIADYDRAIKLEPENAALYRNRADLYRGKGNYNKAIADYKEAVRLNPEDTAIYDNRAFLYEEMGDYDQAIRDCGESIRLNPENSLYYSNRAFFLQKERQLRPCY